MWIDATAASNSNDILVSLTGGEKAESRLGQVSCACCRGTANAAHFSKVACASPVVKACSDALASGRR